ncbi:MAG TPA: hypothetical protein VGH28_08300 [Polyangiaceae bacterium]
MRRPSRVGERTAVVVDATVDESNKTFTEQVLLKHEEKHFRLHLDAVAETREVDAFGAPARSELTIRAFTRDGTAVIAPGKHLVIVSAPKKSDAVVTIDGEPASADVRALVDELVPIGRGAGDADAVFGTHGRKRIGDAWPFDAQAMVSELARTGVIAKPNAIHGQVSLASAERVGGVDCVDLRIDLGVSAFEPEKQLPEGTEITRSRVTVRVDEVLPVDARLPRRADDTVVHAEFDAFVPVKDQVEVAGVTVEHVSDRTRHASYTPLRD